MYKSLWIRSRTALIFGLIMLAFLAYSPMSNKVLIVLIFPLCCYEYLALNKQIGFVIKSMSIALVLGLILISIIFTISTNTIIIIVSLALIYQLYAVIKLFKPKKLLDHLNHPLLHSIGYFALPGIICMNVISMDNPWTYFLLNVFILIWISDSAAYIFGSRFGKRKLIPNVSPNKTVEGFIAAGVSCVFIALVMSFYANNNYLYWAIIGISIWGMGSLGDLVESSIKRFYGVKDSGNILPGHGGFLDRFDSFIFVWPLIAVIQLLILK